MSREEVPPLFPGQLDGLNAKDEASLNESSATHRKAKKKNRDRRGRGPDLGERKIRDPYRKRTSAGVSSLFDKDRVRSASELIRMKDRPESPYVVYELSDSATGWRDRIWLRRGKPPSEIESAKLSLVHRFLAERATGLAREQKFLNGVNDDREIVYPDL